MAEYWGIRMSEAEVIVDQLDALYLLQNISIEGTMYSSLHYLYFSYLKSIVSATRKQILHGRLVSSYK